MSPIRILLINPNSTSSMTTSLQPLVQSLDYKNTTYTFFTAPSGPTSINNEHDAEESAKHCFPHVLPMLEEHEAVLVACYSQHPLVPQLQKHAGGKPILGIFEASVTVALQIVSAERKERFGIVSTGKVWEKLLTDGVVRMLGMASGTSNSKSPFAGVETTGLNATELHDMPQEEVKKKIKQATRRLVDRGNVKVVLLGCAGMAGMDEWVREEVEEGVRIVDGVKAGVGALQGLVRGRF